MIYILMACVTYSSPMLPSECHPWRGGTPHYHPGQYYSLSDCKADEEWANRINPPSGTVTSEGVQVRVFNQCMGRQGWSSQ